MPSRASYQSLQSLILNALREDAVRSDITSRSVVPAFCRIRAQIIAKESGVLSGLEAARSTFRAVDGRLRCRAHIQEGARIRKDQALLSVEGSARSIFAAERVALNFLGHLSGVATQTAACVKALQGKHCAILDTRKTLPGLRALERQAVRSGGGVNHRDNLSTAVLIKTNHLIALKRAGTQNVIFEAIRRAKSSKRGRWIEIEVRNLSELARALKARPDWILLDNWGIAKIRKAVQLRNQAGRRPLLEVSGGMNAARVRAVSALGIERISIGRLTHSSSAVDICLRVL